MGINEILKNKLIHTPELARKIGISPNLLNMKINNIQRNRLTDGDVSKIKIVLDELVNDLQYE